MRKYKMHDIRINSSPKVVIERRLRVFSKAARWKRSAR
jgi:hypothetical protein